MRRVCGWCEKAANMAVVRQLPASKDVNTETKEIKAFKAVTKQQPVKIRQSEKT
jgi:hypothetical protein